MVERKRIGLWSGKFEIQSFGRSNRAQCRQRLTIAATFFSEVAVLGGRNGANSLQALIFDLILFLTH